MKHLRLFWLLCGLIIGMSFMIMHAHAANTPALPATADAVYRFSFTSLSGQPMPLVDYQGKVLLIVNTASACGLANQFAALQKLFMAYKDAGLVVIGVPSNDFGNQEPGNAAQIQEFCTSKFGITFPLTEKLVVSGEQAHPFYQWAAAQDVGSFLQTKPRWNFHKYLFNRRGQLTHSFGSLVEPEDSEIRDAIAQALAEKI